MARSSNGRRSKIFPYTRSYHSLSCSLVFKIPPGEIAGRLISDAASNFNEGFARLRYCANEKPAITRRTPVPSSDGSIHRQQNCARNFP
jgi:hypothetical protein